MTKNEKVDRLDKYLGKYVHAGNKENGVFGLIESVEVEYDDIFGYETYVYIRSSSSCDGNLVKYNIGNVQII